MNIHSVRKSLNKPLTSGFDLYERRPGNHQLILPIHHEDGDMVEIYLEDSPMGEEYVRICDYGLTLMRLSYTYEISTPTRQQIFDSILINSGVNFEEGGLYLDAPVDKLYESILQFAGCAQKVCNMRYWSREITRSAFYDDLEEYITSDLKDFSPSAATFPLPDYPTSVDWALRKENSNFYVFGVHSNDKAKVVALALLEFRQAHLPFISLIVHEAMEALGKKEQLFLTRNADKQYPGLADFQETSVRDIPRLVGVPS
ncbi:MAG: DUF1828 domain-containing protein [Caldilineaceae bacterium SB0668_bin_21]|nr:DUF1828 domain-containing protein [Caldilineaceae bacterium SB0668_bin_21]MYC21499.1 DUF1828 domain-containing protein [Caldilineaceae bacterium SB0662_bin_25]